MNIAAQIRRFEYDLGEVATETDIEYQGFRVFSMDPPETDDGSLVVPVTGYPSFLLVKDGAVRLAEPRESLKILNLINTAKREIKSPAAQ